ncbi:hypothetical protein [Methylosinus sp. Sm6]|uniref:hypothetical protein n=1 Tax=Methylosinus sp. Sm6 TaxID=2866948 RepID=UPI00351D8C66
MKVAIFVLGALLLAGPAVAAERGTADQRAACTPDVFRLCMSEIPNVDGIVACLKREKTQLSSGCRSVIAGDEKRLATRSIRSDADWCLFDKDAAATDEVWRSWCRDKARVE